MKADHHKATQPPTLGHRLSQYWQEVKSGKKTSSTLVWGIIILAVVVYAGWRWYDRSRTASNSALWLRVDSATSLVELATIADEHSGTTAGRIAAFQMARVELRNGLRNLAAEGKRKEALESLEKARDLYAKLTPLCKNDPLLAMEALMGVAVVHESKGELDQALNAYRQVVADYPDSFQAQTAQKRIEELEKSRAEVQKFYQTLDKQASPRAPAEAPSPPK